MITFTDGEIRALQKDVKALRALADWHDLQATIGDSQGIDCSANVARQQEILAEADRIQQGCGDPK